MHKCGANGDQVNGACNQLLREVRSTMLAHIFVQQPPSIPYPTLPHLSQPLHQVRGAVLAHVLVHQPLQ